MSCGASEQNGRGLMYLLNYLRSVTQENNELNIELFLAKDVKSSSCIFVSPSRVVLLKIVH